jgi:signal transduction histidine kinase
MILSRMRLNIKLALVLVWLGAVITPFIIVSISSHYFFNPYAFGSLFVSYFVGALGILIASKGLEKKERQQLFLLSLCFSGWLWAVGIGDLCKFGDGALAAVWYRASVTAVVFIAPQFYSFTVAFLKLERRKVVAAGYLIGCIFALLNIFTHYMVDRVQWFRWGYYARWEIIRTLPFMAYFSMGLGLTLVELIRAHRRSNDERLKNQIKYIIFASCIAYLGSVDYLTVYGYNVYPCGYLAIFGWWTILAYAILKHQLMDIAVVIRKTLVYSAVTLSLTIVYVVVLIFIAKALEGWVGTPNIYSSAIAAAVIAVLFHPVRSHIQQWVDRRFPRESLNQTILREATGRFIHEIKRPLANISMPAQLALMDLDQAAANFSEFKRLFPKLRERMQYIIDESLKAGQKIEAIQNVSSQSFVERDVVDLGKLVSRLLEQDQSRIIQAKIELIVSEIKPALCTLGNSVQLEIAIANVLKNAIDALIRDDHSHARQLRVSLDCEGEWIGLDIEDSGAGIASNDLSHLFEPWFSTKGSGGMGIGLYLTRESLRSHGARIEVKSRPGSTVFNLLFRRVSDFPARI